MEEKDFVHLHVHTEYSLKDASNHISDIINKVQKSGMKSVAVTDHGNMHASMDFYNQCCQNGLDILIKELTTFGCNEKELNEITKLISNMSIANALKECKELSKYKEKYPKAFGIALDKEVKPIIGIETYVLPNKGMLEVDELKHTKYHLVLLAKDFIGYHQLCKAATRSQLLKDKHTYPRMTYDDMEEIFVDNHVIALSACISGEIPKCLLKGYEKRVEIKYLEESLSNDRNDLVKAQNEDKKLELPVDVSFLDYAKFKEEEIIEKEQSIKEKKSNIEIRENSCYENAKKIALSYMKIFGNENFFIEVQKHGLEKEKYVYPKLLQIAKELNLKIVATNDCHYAEEKDARKREMLVALRFKRKITDENFQHDTKQLYIKTGQEMKDLFSDVPEAFNNTKYIADRCNIIFKKEKHFPVFQCPIGFTEEQYLEKLTYDGLKRKYKVESLSEFERNELNGRIRYELEVIEKLKYSGYLLIVSDFIKRGRKIGEIGPGRGSAVGSVVCYCLDITNVEPLRYNLIFERFLNSARVSDPDIDTDFDDTRDLVIEYVEEKYGHEAVCQIVTFGTMAARAAIRNVGRVTDKSLKLCDRIAKMVPLEVGITLESALKKNEKLLEEYNTNKDAKELIDDAMSLEGTVIQTGVHAAGIIIADKAVDNYVPLMYNEEKAIWVTQYSKDICEKSCGLLKMDFLGLENLTIIKRTLKDIKKNHNVTLSIDNIPLDDKEVIKKIFAKGKTKGVFQFESGGMMDLLINFGPTSFEDIILLVAAYRPGPIQYLKDIIEVKHKRKKPSYILSEMEEILGVTYGKPIYQEQIMEIFHKIANFSLGVADIIRRAMAKKKLKILKKYIPKFRKALIEKGALEEDVDKFCEELMNFASYAFNKSHAAAYAVVAYITGYLKYYYPVEYMSNVLNSCDNKTLSFYLKECKDLNIPILSPNINESGKLFTPTTEKTILFGLEGIKNVSKAAIETIKIRNKYNKFDSFKDFVNKLNIEKSPALNKKVIESLIYSGAFDDFGNSRNDLVGGLKEYTEDIKLVKNKSLENEEIEIQIKKSYKKCNKIIQQMKDTENVYLKDTLLNSLNVDCFNEYLKLLKDYFKKIQKPKTREATIERAISKIENTNFEEKYLNYSIIKNDNNYEYIEECLKSLSELKRNLSLSKSRVISINKTCERLKEYNYFIAKQNLSKNELLYKEKDLIGYYATGNPLKAYSSLIQQRSSFSIGDLIMDLKDINSNIEERDGLKVEIVCEVEDFKILNRKSDGAEMCSFSINDLTGNMDCIIFVKQYAKYKHLITNNNICIVKGFLKVEMDLDNPENNKLQINVQEIEEIKNTEKVYIKVQTFQDWTNKVKQLVEESIGYSPLYVYVEKEQQLYKVKKEVDIDTIKKKVYNTLGKDHLAIA